MLYEHAKILALIKQTGEIAGRKKLQKIIYIAKSIGLPFHEKYHYHMYGPYSEELTLRVEEICELEFVTEVKEKKSGYQQYRYALADKGREFLAMLPDDFPERTELFREMNDHSSKFLELVATVLYFEGLSKEEVTNKVFKLKAKQNYTAEDLEAAYRYITKIRHIT